MDADIVVVGLGAWGSAALWRLAARGTTVIGIDAAAAPHPYGSSHGHTRLFRVACHEHPGLTPIARRSLDLWQQLGETTGQRLVEQTGCLSIGPADGRAIHGVTQALARADIDADRLAIEEVRQQFGQHVGLSDHWVGVWDREAGFVHVERTIASTLRQAEQLGATVWSQVAATDIRPLSDGVEIITAARTIRARQVVVAAGPWLSLLSDVVDLTPLRAPMLWWQAADSPADFELAAFPCFIRHFDEQHTIWGHGSIGEIPIKVGLSQDPISQQPVDPRQLDRGIRPERDWRSTADVVRTALPGLRPEPLLAAPCMITESPDHQFVVGRDPGRPNIILAGGCSGHGFKHAPGIGELVAQIATDEQPFTDIEFMDPARF